MSEYGDLIWFLLIGLAAGWFAGVVFKRNDLGVLGNMIVGVVGAILGGVIFDKLDINVSSIVGNKQLGTLIAALAGSMIFLALLSFLKPKGKKDK